MRRLPLKTVNRQKDPLPLVNFFAETLRETLDEWDVSQAEVSRMTGIPSPHLTDMKKSKRRCTSEYELRLSSYFGTSPGFWLRKWENSWKSSASAQFFGMSSFAPTGRGNSPVVAGWVACSCKASAFSSPSH